MKIFKLIPLIFFLSTGFPFFISAQINWSPEHVYYGKGGRLVYTPDDKGNTIPDFSHVGYRYGDEPIPDIPVVIEVSPVEGDDGATIQAAINSLYSKTPDENGFRGAVLLKKGTYQVSGQIRIEGSGIVLRGEGDTEDGTIIIAEGTSQRNLIQVHNAVSRSVISSSGVSIIEDYVPVGRTFVKVANASGFTSGDLIVIYRPGTSQWISDLKMDQIPLKDDIKVVQWSPSTYSFYFERLITRVSGDTLFFRNPVVMAIETKYGGGKVYRYAFNRLRNIGVEDLCLKSVYTSDTDEEHSWNAIYFNSIEHGWARNVTSWHFANSCVYTTGNAKLITLENCHNKEPKSVITGGRRYSFNINGSLCLVKNCTTSHGRHDYVNGAYVTGPNVFTNSTATNTHSDIGPHHRWAMGSLFDAIVSDGSINVQDRDNSGTGHGWAGANTVFWNCKGSSSVCQSPWVSAKNYNFGFIGQKSLGRMPDRPNGEWVGHNIPGIFPVSLYEAQLDDRLNHTTLFSLLPSMTQPTDSSLLLQFTLPVNAETVTRENFTISLSVKAETTNLFIHQPDDFSVLLTSQTFKKLPCLTTIVVKTENITSQDGRSLQGITSVSLTTPDLRPLVTGMSKIVDNVNDYVEASSSKSGTIYFIPYGLEITLQSQLDSLVKINQGRKAEAPVAGEPVVIQAQGLPGGYYQFYAVDQDRRVSMPSAAWIIVEQKGPVSATEDPRLVSSFKAWQHGGELKIDPGDNMLYTLEIYTLGGKQIYREENLQGISNINPGGMKGLVLLRKRSEKGFDSIKLVINL